MPPLSRRCMESWKKFCCDYEIIRWDERNFSIDQSPKYVRQAYAAKKWAFVSDYVRLFVLYRYGGIYMDTDVEVIKPIDRFLVHGAFSGFEDETSIPTGIMGSEPRNPWIGMLLEDYNHREFVKPDGSYDYTTNVKVITELTVERYGLIRNNTLQELADGVVLYPNSYFCPKSIPTGKIAVADVTHTIHHFAGSWVGSKTSKVLRQWRDQALDIAFTSYQDRDWRTAYSMAFLSLYLNPKLIFNRGMWAVILKSVWRDWLDKQEDKA